jgi:hypothetical protein
MRQCHGAQADAFDFLQFQQTVEATVTAVGLLHPDPHEWMILHLEP